MGLFSDNSSPYDEIVESATGDQATGEKWDIIMDICDKVSAGSRGGNNKHAKAALLSIKKRLNHRDPHVVMLALGLLDACMINAGVLFRREVCSREFIGELSAKATCSVNLVGERTRYLIKKWSEEECKTDASLAMIGDLYKELRADSWTFPDPESGGKKKSATVTRSLDPNVVDTQEEQDAIAKAIAESLKTAPSSSNNTPVVTSNGNVTKSSAYPDAMRMERESHRQTPVNNDKHRVVKALYDFEAAEENELTFKAGELITVVDDTDLNWWRGTNARGEGLFPTSFVTADLAKSVMTDADDDGATRKVQFADTVEVKEVEKTEEKAVVIDDKLIDTCLAILQDADPTGVVPDSQEGLEYEKQCAQMTPLIDAELASIDRRHNALAEVDIKLRDALALYDTAMAQAVKQLNITQPPQYAQPSQQQPQQPLYHQQQQPPMYYGNQAQQQPQYAPVSGANVMPQQQPPYYAQQPQPVYYQQEQPK